jgi:hypothetical protein
MNSKSLKMFRSLVAVAPDTVQADDAIIVLRDVMSRRRQITVTAEWNPRQEIWLVVGRVDGALHDSCNSGDPERDGTADRMLEELASGKPLFNIME